MTQAPWFEDFQIGDAYSDVPRVTITEGYCVVHQALFGDRLRLCLDAMLCREVTGVEQPLVNPALVCNLAIGQTTIASQRVLGNLFYRGLLLRQPVFVGDTLKTTTKVVALRQNTIKPGRAASGMVVLEIHVTNQHDDIVMLFWRCPMIPCRDPMANTGHQDDFSLIPKQLPNAELLAAVPDWHYTVYRTRCPGSHFRDLEPNTRLVVESADTVTLAPELARMTLNLAMTHTDASRSVYGKRLVYGGHAIAMAAAQMTRALPNLMTILGWLQCDHTAPVFEQDILHTEITIQEKKLLPQGGIAILQVETFANRGPEAPEAGSDIKVLDWHLAALFA